MSAWGAEPTNHGGTATHLSPSVSENIGGGLVTPAVLEPNHHSGHTEALICHLAAVYFAL